MHNLIKNGSKTIHNFLYMQIKRDTFCICWIAVNIF